MGNEISISYSLSLGRGSRGSSPRRAQLIWAQVQAQEGAQHRIHEAARLLSIGRGTTIMAASLISGTDKGSSRAKVEPQTSSS